MVVSCLRNKPIVGVSSAIDGMKSEGSDALSSLFFVVGTKRF
jgi:hypothetical protein